LHGLLTKKKKGKSTKNRAFSIIRKWGGKVLEERSGAANRAVSVEFKPISRKKGGGTCRLRGRGRKSS